MDNPFSIVSPEELTAEQADQLFVEVHSDYPEIIRQGNMLITGARGCGKSMLIRCSLPDFLMVRNHLTFSELPYLALNVSIKKTDLNIADLQKLDNIHMPYLVNEHIMVLHVLLHTFLNLSKVSFETEKFDRAAYESFVISTYQRYLTLSGCEEKVNVDCTSPNTFFLSLYEHLENQSYNFFRYIAALTDKDAIDYSYHMPLLSFTRFIVPVFKKMIELPGFPNGKPILLFIDDADNLSEIQTRILNAWIASRTQPTISLKVFAQIGLYKTYLTSAGVLVESPHDYQELNISSKYTTKSNSDSTDNYYNKVIYVLYRRLKKAGYAPDIDYENFNSVEEYIKSVFPTYEKQEEGILQEIELIKKEYSKRGRGYRESDDIRRYAVPNYIRRLGGSSKSRSTYRYAGIECIVHLSSGIIRYLLDSVAKMFDATTKSTLSFEKVNPLVIETDVQNTVLRAKADFYLFKELPKSNDITNTLSSNLSIKQSTTEKLANLINAMGKTFQEILLSGNPDDPFSGRSERKVFSIALSNPENTSTELKEVFRLGVRLGFLHESFIGNKEGNGRTYLYIMNRCFSPIFTLDPSGFQGYLFMRNEDLETAIHTGKKLRNIDTNETDEIHQLSLFDFWEE